MGYLLRADRAPRTQPVQADTTPTDRHAYRELLDDADVAWMPWVGPLTIDTARRIACDCTLTPVLMDDGAPLDLGRTTRTPRRSPPRFTPPSSIDPHKKPIPAHNRAGPQAA
ncbi:DUF222 domain-containing protein [Rhodococcus sp. W8901]|nr:DUF222 domain-containing protein [Rhodococcus sp. W8901]